MQVIKGRLNRAVLQLITTFHRSTKDDQAQQTFCVDLLAKLPGLLSYLLCRQSISPHVVDLRDFTYLIVTIICRYYIL